MKKLKKLLTAAMCIASLMCILGTNEVMAENVHSGVKADMDTVTFRENCKLIYNSKGEIPADKITIRFIGTDGVEYEASVREAYRMNILSNAEIGFYADGKFNEYAGQKYINKVSDMRFVIRKIVDDGVYDNIDFPKLRQASTNSKIASLKYDGKTVKGSSTYKVKLKCNKSGLSIKKLDVELSDEEASMNITKATDGTITVRVTAEDDEYVTEYTVEAVIEHTESDWIVDKQATESKNGKRHKECTVCGAVTRSEEIDKLDSKKDVKSFTVKGIKYRVIGNKKVEVTGASDKNIASLSIGSTVKYKDKTYSITKIADKAFKGYSKISKVTIGDKVTTIGTEAFKGCKQLSKITIKSSKLKIIGKQAIKGISKKAKIKVPSKKLKDYKKLISNKAGYTKTMKISK